MYNVGTNVVPAMCQSNSRLASSMSIAGRTRYITPGTDLEVDSSKVKLADLCVCDGEKNAAQKNTIFLETNH